MWPETVQSRGISSGGYIVSLLREALRMQEPTGVHVIHVYDLVTGKRFRLCTNEFTLPSGLV